MMDGIRDGLNKRQLEVVTGPSRHTLVIAGAGTGKTTVLTRRIAWMVGEKGVPPDRILVSTFTNKAADEMRERIASLLQGNVKGMWAGTFHSLCNRMLRHHTDLAGLPQNWFVVDADEQTKVMKRVLENGRHDGASIDAKDAVEHVNALKDKGLRPPRAACDAMRVLYGSGEARLKSAHKAGTVEPLDMVAADYQAYCDSAGVVDFGELIVRTNELLNTHHDLRDRYRNKFRHVLVDEFQDTNKVQFDLCMQFAGEKNRLWAVGDDDQSIYAWRGAEPSNMMKFRNRLTEGRTVKLEHNYRSTDTILDAANAVISNNTERLEAKNLFCEKGAGDKIALVRSRNVFGEAETIADTAKNWIDRDNSASDVAVLYRTSAQSRLIEQALALQGIKCVIKGGQKFFEREEVRDAIGYIRLMRERKDDVAFARVYNKPARKLGERTFDAIKAVADERRSSLWEAANELVSDMTMKDPARTNLRNFLTLVDDLSEGIEEMSVAEIAQVAVNDTGLIKHYGAKKGEQGASKVENLTELVQACGEYGTLNAFLDEAALDAGEIDDDTPAVRLMTIHSAKGLEFPLVVLAGMDQSIFPHPRSENVEEERRLAYVAITRAQERLVMTYPAERSWGGDEPRSTTPSEFVNEIPRDLIEVIDKTRSFEQNRRRSGNYRRSGEGRRQKNYRYQNRKAQRNWSR